jgi:signal transduction histidine kinase
VQTQLILKAQEHALLDYNRTLEEKIEARSEELKQAMQHLMQSEKLASLGGMVAGITHELNTPMSNVRLAAEGMATKVRELAERVDQGKLTRTAMDDFLAYCKKTCELIDRASDRSASLLQSFKQVAVDQTSERRYRFDLREIVEHTVQMLEPTLRMTSHEVLIDIPAGIMLDSYPGPLEQIVTNLITNSIAHAFPGRSHGVMRVDAMQDSGRLELTYSDNGIGIPDDIKPRIFDPFFTTKAGKGGSGLGMYTVFNLAKGIFGGSITIGDAPGGGARFTLLLALVPEPHP